MKHDLKRGARYAITAAGALASAGAMIKLGAADLPNVMVVWLRSVFGLLLLAPWVLRSGRGGISYLKTRRLRMHLLRASFGVAAMYCFFYAISQLHLADAVLLNYSQPLFIPFIAWLWLSERPAKRVYPAIFIGFIGVAFILKPSMGLVSLAGLAGIGSGLFAAIAMVSIRRMSDTETAVRIVAYFMIFATLFTSIPALIFWQTPSSYDLSVMFGAGVFATIGQLLLTQAYALAPAAYVGSLVYTAVIFAALWGWAVWHEIPNVYSVFGAILVIIAALLVVFVRRPHPRLRRS